MPGQRGAVSLNHWSVSQWAPPPSEGPLGSNCQPAAVSGPVQSLVGTGSGPLPLPFVCIKVTERLSALASSFEKPLRQESEVEEEANAQAEAQKKKDEAEVQVKLYTHGSHRSRNKGSQRPGTLVQIVDCMPTI